MFILLFLFWILLNGKLNLEIALIGIILCGAVYLFACFFLNFTLKKDFNFFKTVHLLIAFYFMLVLEVVKSNLNIISLIWSKKEPDPRIVHFNVTLKSTFLRVLFANAITLTPGTITINLNEKEYVVHALRYDYIDGIENSKLLKLLKKMEAK